MDLLLIVGFLPIMVVASLASAEKKVTMKLITTSCRHDSCKTYNDVSCPSSILINDRETSRQKDGFNIVVIDNVSGNVTDSTNIRWFSETVFWRKAKFKNYLKNVPFHSTVAIVFQNMCKTYSKDWYTLLTDFNLKLDPTYEYGSYSSIVVGCKGECPYAVDGNIPYTYYGNEAKFEASITLDLKGSPPDHKKYPLTEDKDVILIIGVAVGLIVAIAIVYALITCYRRRQYYQKTESKTLNESIPCSPREGNPLTQPHEPYNELKSDQCPPYMSDDEFMHKPYPSPLPSAPPMYSDIDPMMGGGFIRSCDV